MKKKVTGKLNLSKETVCRLDELDLKMAAGGILTNTNACSNCTACASCVNTCMIDTGVCAETCTPACFG